MLLVMIFVVSGFIDHNAAAREPGGCDRGMPAYAVAFGGSMIWFALSASLAHSNMYLEAKSVERWLHIK